MLDNAIPDLKSMREAKRDVRRELDRALRGIRDPVLYVIDNVPETSPGEHVRSIEHFCPAHGAVTVLATSRQDTREAGVQTIPVGTLGNGAAILLLTENLVGAGRLTWGDWGHIVNWVGDLPLALDLLNRSLALSSISIEDLFQRATVSASAAPQLEALADALRGQVPRDSVRGVIEAFSVSFEKLDTSAQFTAVLLAQLAPAPIPEALVDALPEDLKSPIARTALRSRHFVTAGDNLTFGTMHRLVAEFVRHVTPDDLKALETAWAVIGPVITIERCADPLQWPVMNLFRPHVTALMERTALAGSMEVRAAVHIVKVVAMLAGIQADYAEERRLLERLVEMTRRTLGAEDPVTLRAMSHYARNLLRRGDHKGARSVQEHVLQKRVKIKGAEHPDTLDAMGDLAETLHIRGEYEETQRLQERVLQLRILLGGEKDSETLRAMGALAETLVARAKYAEARRLQERVLELRVSYSGEEDPKTLTAMSDLARTLSTDGSNAEALQLLERVFRVRMRVLGEQHLDTLKAMGNLADFLAGTGNDERATRLAERALEIYRSILGEKHPLTLNSMELLAGILSSHGDQAEARRLRERVIQEGIPILGEENTWILSVTDRLAETLLAQRDFEECRRLHKWIFDTRTRVLGAEHPDTLNSMSILAVFLLKSGDAQNGLQLLRQCLAGRRKVLGDEHPTTTDTAEVLLKFEHEQGAGGDRELGKSKAGLG